MSLDSKAARFSVAGLNGPYLIGVFPDSGLSKIWRQAAGWGYAGNAIASAAAVEVSFRVHIARLGALNEASLGVTHKATLGEVHEAQTDRRHKADLGEVFE